MRSTQKIESIALLCCALISSCSSNTATATLPAIQSITATSIASPTIQVIPTLTPTIAITATPAKPVGVEYHCIDIGDDVANLGSVKGTLVLNGYLDPGAKSNPSLLLDIHSGNQISFVIDDLPRRFVVSPNEDYLAFDISLRPDYRKTQINILNSKGEILAQPVVQNVYGIEWLNDTILLVNSFNENSENHPLLFLFPFEQKQNIMQPFVTEAERIGPFDSELIREWGFYAYHKIIYNPTLTRAIYAASDEDGAKVVFRDLESNKDVSVLRSYDAWGMSPKWSPDGTKLAIGVDTNSVANTRKYELVILDQNGKQLHITRLSKFFEPVYISSLSWSPDGTRVAFWYTTNEDVNRDLRLAVFDTAIQKAKDYCIIGAAPAHLWHRNDTSPIWSPDGNYLLVETPNNVDSNPNVVIVDLVQERAVIIKTGYEPVGWMK